MHAANACARRPMGRRVSDEQASLYAFFRDTRDRKIDSTRASVGAQRIRCQCAKKGAHAFFNSENDSDGAGDRPKRSLSR